MIIFVALGHKKYDKNASWNPKIFATAVGLGTFGTLFYFLNRLKLLNSIPGWDLNQKPYNSEGDVLSDCVKIV